MKNSARAAGVVVSADGRSLVSQAGAVLLWETMQVTGLGRDLSQALAQLPRRLRRQVLVRAGSGGARTGSCSG